MPMPGISRSIPRRSLERPNPGLRGAGRERERADLQHFV